MGKTRIYVENSVENVKKSIVFVIYYWKIYI